MIFKILLFILVSLIFIGCSFNRYTFDKKQKEISFSIYDKSIKVTLSKPIYKNTYSRCSLDTYKLNDENFSYGSLYIEHIELDNSCSWNGLASGYFIDELKNRLKFKSFNLINKFTKSNYEISTYLIDNKKYLDIIDIYEVNKNIFIIDNKGKLSSLLISKLDKDYKYKYLDKLRADIKYSYSLVDNNIFFSYFGREIEYK